ncbi:cytochrome c oxidase assembly protein [Smaragdicoccus niigatensis]|uniref:cytochrome c oxidase assembly protein n=1 Tax=Smaragdicoccus niigatensis TaxID=359359 RepID=UPI0003797C5D|nr:cytochrome c oxidase assembly protein [Smaragdicoccus niigatensis]
MPIDLPFSPETALFSWQFDSATVLPVAIAGIAYFWSARGQAVPRTRMTSFGVGLLIWIIAGCGFIGVYSHVLFWMRALQILLLLYLVPLFLAAGTPVTVFRAALTERRRQRLDAYLQGRVARVLLHPLPTSLGLIALPWLLYLTGWYVASLRYEPVDVLTRSVLVLVGFTYYYARIQADPVPRRFTQGISLVITIVEQLGDGILGVVLWQGPVRFAHYYAALGLTWGLDARLDQTIGAGILWILGDVIGLPFLLLLGRSFSAEDRAQAKAVDRELDARTAVEKPTTMQSGLWWENDPQFRDRMRR